MQPVKLTPSLTEDQILQEAQRITAERAAEQAFRHKRQWQAWYNRYARSAGPAHNLAKPRKLLPEEAVLLYALERNGYTVEGEAPNLSQGGKWHGHAECRWHLRDMVISQFAPDRLSLLWSLWTGVSGKSELTEEDLQGGLRRTQIQQLQKELREQKPEPDEACPCSA